MKLIELARRLFPLNRSITGQGIEESYTIFRDLHPELQPLSFCTGEKVFDWTVPQVWNIVEGYIADKAGNRYCDFSTNNLHVVGYSKAVNAWLTKEELREKIFTRPDLPDAVPYVTSYYKRTWGFCMSHRDYQAMPDGPFHCYIDATHTDGKMNVQEAIFPGESDRVIFFSSYLCHPSMANNELSGPVVLSGLMDHVRKIADRRYTYVFVLLPETIGSIAYLSRRHKYLREKTIMGFNVSCVGDEQRFTHLSSRSGNSLADLAISSALSSRDNVVRREFKYRGSDERQYNWPGIDLPVCGFSRSMYGEYPEYHTSLDNFNVVTEAGLQGSLEVLIDVVDGAEAGLYPQANCLCEPQLSKHDLYPEQVDGILRKGYSRDVLTTRLDILANADGANSIYELALATECSLRSAISEILLLQSRGIMR